MPEQMGRGNPDAAQDETLIQDVMRRDLGPILMAVGERLKDLEEDLGETKDLLFKFMQGLIGVADNHRRTSLEEEISSKYGSDLAPLDDFYRDTTGKGFKDSILEALMGDEAPGDDERDGWIQTVIQNAKGKFGKYLGGQKPEAMPEEGEAPDEAVIEESAEAPEEQAAEEESGGESPEEDNISRLQRKLFEVGGERQSLSGKPRKGRG